MIDRILALIKHKGWNISEFERRLGKSTGTFNGWRRRNAVPPNLVLDVADILDTTEEYLRGEIEDPGLFPGYDKEPKVTTPDDPAFLKLLESAQRLTEKEMVQIQAMIDLLNQNKEG